MTKKLEDAVIEEMRHLFFGEGLPIKEIEGRLKLSHYTVYVYTKAFERGFKGPAEYREYRARKNGHTSRKEYIRHLEQVNRESEYKRKKRTIKRRGFSSIYEYNSFLARRKGFSGEHEYQEYLRKRKRYGEKFSRLRLGSRIIKYRKNIQGTVVLGISPKLELEKRLLVESKLKIKLGEIMNTTHTNAEINFSLREDILYLTPKDLESRAFLDALFLSSDLTDRIVYGEAA